MLKRTLITFLIVANALTVGVHAEPLSQSEIELDIVLSKIADSESEIQKINSNIDNLQSDINKNKNEIKKINQEIKDNEESIKDITKSINDRKELIAEKAKSVYMNNDSEAKQYLKVMVSATSIKELASKFKTIRKVFKSNNDILAEYNKDKEILTEKQSFVKEQKLSLNNKIKNLENELRELTLKKNEKGQLLEEHNELKVRYENEIAQSEALLLAEVNNTQVDIVEDTTNDDYYESDNDYNDDVVVDNTPSYDYVPESSVVNIAFKYLGVPYVWGGTTPSGFDCSGFAQYVYREAGINISRTTYTQITEGYSVSELAPGDLVFFGSYSAPYHVGIYIGNNNYIHAPMEGDVVKVSSLSYKSDFCGGRRYY